MELCRESLPMFREAGDRLGEASVLVHLGWAQYIAGDLDAGKEQMALALSIARAIGYEPVAANSLHGLAYGAQVSGDLATARRRLVESLAALRRAGMVGGEPSWLWATAALAAEEGRFESAARLVGGAEGLSQRSGSEITEWFMSPLQPQLDRAFAELGTEASARLVAEGSRMSLEALMMHAVEDPDAEDVDPLSPREREVVALVARGLTNTQIAEQLFISKRTVESHVDHIKQKLRCRSRSQVIAWALREATYGVRVGRSDPEAAGAAP
jgi:DNA-binding CsgD family transcriptional regulator